MPLDQFDREINYLRISVTDRCNLRCTYCMPLKDSRFAPTPELLTADEIGAVVAAAVEVGFRKFRLTGGEPTLRNDLTQIVRAVKRVPGVAELAMTTNGILMPELAVELKEAGLDRVNLHLDTLNEERLRQIMRFHDLERAWKGILACEAAGLTPLKMNTVVVKGQNELDVVELAELTLARDWHVRFIELMPLGGGECASYSRDRYVPNPVTKRRIEERLGPLAPLPRQNPSDESRNYRLPDARGVIGFISPVSAPFCGTCNRMRLTADGKFHLCLLGNTALDVRGAIRERADPEELRAILRQAVAEKPIGHRLHQGESNEVRSMHQVGG